MTIQSTTKRLTTTASALSLGFLLCGQLATAADAPAATPAPVPAIETYPSWTAQERQQHWEQMQQSARELWAKVNLSPEQRQQYWEQVQQGAQDLWDKWGLSAQQRQHYWEQMQQGWNDLVAMVNPPAETPPTAPASAAPVAVAATPPTAPAPAAPVAVAATPSTAPTPAAPVAVAAMPPTAPAPATPVAVAATPSTELPAAAGDPPKRVYDILSLWGLTSEQR